MSDSLGLKVEYRALTQLPPVSDPWWHCVLGLAHFSQQSPRTPLDPIPVIQIPMMAIPAGDTVCEVWRATGSMRNGQIGSVMFRATDQLLFGCISLPENGASSSQGSPGHHALEHATTVAYADIFDALDTTGFPRLVRIWNHISAINEPVDDGDRYWLFNSARHKRFIARRGVIEETVPAASAVGTPSGNPLVIYFLATTASVSTIENPRQISAYRYPQEYGPYSPTFSRAALLTQAASCTLFVSGTASIVGHQTRHVDDVEAQTRETLANIQALVRQANERLGSNHLDISKLSFKVYVRHPDDQATIAAEILSVIGKLDQVLFLQADVCRSDLLVEIEAVGVTPIGRAGRVGNST